MGGYWKIARELVLYKDSKSVYRVDFCRKQFGQDLWDFVELKSPTVPVAKKIQKHWRFSSPVEKALHQASDYRDFFEEELNRIELEWRTGIRVFRPKLLLICGRSSEQIDAVELRRLTSRYQDTDIKSYDELYEFAKENYHSHDLIAVPIIQNFEVIEKRNVVISVNLDKSTENDMVKLRTILEKHPGTSLVYIKVEGVGLKGSQLYIARRHKINPTREFTSSVKEFGDRITITLAPASQREILDYKDHDDEGAF